MKIINKYVLREHAGPFFFALTALTSLLVLNYIAKQFGNLVGKGLPWSIIGEFFALSIPFTIAMTLAMSVLIATLYAFSRLAAENEITALKASGISMVRLLIPVLFAGLVVGGVMLWVHDYLLPHSNHRLRVLQGDIARKKPTFALRPRIINEVVSGRYYMRANIIDEFSNRMREVTIYDMSDPMRQRTIYADSGDMSLARGSDLMLTLHVGNMQEVPKATPDQIQRLFFNVDYVKIANVANKFDTTTDDNYKSDREKSICELQRDVARDEREFEISQHHLERIMVALAREGATGQKAQFEMYSPGPPSAGLPPYPVVKGSDKNWVPRRRRTIGRYYCELARIISRPFGRSGPSIAAVGALFSPSTAYAAEAPAQTDNPQRRDTTKADSARIKASALRIPGQTPTPVVPPPSPGAEPEPEGIPVSSMAAVDGSRQRASEKYSIMNSNAVEIQKKFALSAACVVFVLVGAPIALRFPRGGVGMTMGVSLVIFAMYYVGLIAGEALGDRGILPPALAMWWPNMILTAVGLGFLAKMGSEATTSRGGDFGELIFALTQWAKRLLGRGGSAAAPPRRREAV